MMIQILLLVLLAFIGGLILLLMGVIGWIFLKLFKNELNLKIPINSDNQPS